MPSCPICKKTSTVTYKPFCSKRCADIDLAQWLNGAYTLPSTEPLGDNEIEQVIDHAQSQIGRGDFH